MNLRRAISRFLDLAFETWRALASYRRGPAILVACTPMVAAQWSFGAGWGGVFVGAAMCFSFVAAAPLSWRACFPGSRTVRWPALRMLAYAASGVLVIYGMGTVLPAGLRIYWTFLTEDTSLMVLLGLYWVGGWGLGRDIDFEADLRRQRALSEALSVEKEHAQLLALRTHLDPHFLFNTLNAIAEWCREDPEVAEAAIVRLAGVLRTMLGGLQKERWPLKDELALCEDVIALHEVRDPGRFKYQRTGAAPDVAVPPLLLLPLVENAMTHGPAAGHRGAVQLRLETGEDTVTIELENPGGFTGERDGGHGLDTVRRRLVLAWGAAASLEIRATGNGESRTRTRVVLPLAAGLPGSRSHRLEERT